MNLKEFIEKYSVDLHQLAEESGVSLPTIYRILDTKTPFKPSYETLEKLSKVTGLPFEKIV